MDLATKAMGISDEKRAFAKDVLSIEIEGPSRPQLTLVDIPGLIQSSTKGVTDEDVALVTEITDHYISQHRTICLAVVSATNDAANQSILRKVRVCDGNGDRTLGIITKPDRLPSGSGSETKFIELARNEDVFFKLGWHVLKNRAFEQSASSLIERNASETMYFRTSNFNQLPKENVGIGALRSRLSLLLFEHVKNELPKLREDLEVALDEAQSQLKLLGERRSATAECRAYLAQLSLDYWELCKAAVNGHYEGDYFKTESDEEFSVDSRNAVARLRAVVQHLNTGFGEIIRTKGHKYQLNLTTNVNANTAWNPKNRVDTMQASAKPVSAGSLKRRYEPVPLERTAALKWARKGLVRTRGKELVGNFNPLLIGELFWEQSCHWRSLAEEHIETMARMCEKFLRDLLERKCVKDVRTRIWTTKIADKLKARRADALHELEMIIDDNRSFPINYNHYYTDTITKNRRARQKAMLSESIAAGTTIEIKDTVHNGFHGFGSGGLPVPATTTQVDVEKVVDKYNSKIDPDMEGFSCEEALDCVMAIYKVSFSAVYNCFSPRC